MNGIVKCIYIYIYIYIFMYVYSMLCVYVCITVQFEQLCGYSYSDLVL